MVGEDTSQPPQPPIASTEAPQMVSSVKLPILKKGEYILWTIKMKQYLAHTDYTLWEQILARTKERKAKSTLLMVIPDEHLTRFHGIKDANTLWAAIKTRFGGVSTEDANQKFLRYLSSAWSNISLLMRNKPGIDNLDIDDMYNNLKFYEADIKGSFGSTSNTQNVDFVSAESTSSNNKFNAAYNVSTVTGNSSQAQISSSYIDEFMFSFFANQSSPRLDNEDLERGHFARDCRSARNLGTMSRDAGNVGYKRRDNEEEVTKTMFDNRSSDKEDSLSNDRFKKDDSIYKFKISETVASLTKDAKDVPKTSTACVEKPKEDRSSAPLIEDWDTDSDDGSVFRPEPIHAKIDFVKAGESDKHVKPIESIIHVKPVESVNHVKPVESVKHVKAIKPVKTAEHTKKSKKFSSNRMAKKYVLPTNVGKGTGHRESRPVWNNVQRINHQNKFSLTAIFTRSSRVPVIVAKPKAAASISAAKPVNTARPKQSVNFLKSRIGAVKGDGVTAVKTSAGCVCWFLLLLLVIIVNVVHSFLLLRKQFGDDIACSQTEVTTAIRAVSIVCLVRYRMTHDCVSQLVTKLSDNTHSLVIDCSWMV
nr:ribonuclease H-like domain-containing protein [Tanacetum cinerariifolium]